MVQNHAGRGGGNDFGDGGQIVNGASGYGRGSLFISKTPEAFVRDKFALVGDGNSRTGEGALVDAGTQDVKGALELFVLLAG